MMALAGFLVAIAIADAYLTRDGIQRSKGKIFESNKLMVWFMATNFRAILVTVVEAAVYIAGFAFIERSGIWYAGVVLFLVVAGFRGQVVLRNYRINTDIL